MNRMQTTLHPSLPFESSETTIAPTLEPASKSACHAISLNHPSLFECLIRSQGVGEFDVRDLEVALEGVLLLDGDETALELVHLEDLELDVNIIIMRISKCKYARWKYK